MRINGDETSGLLSKENEEDATPGFTGRSFRCSPSVRIFLLLLLLVCLGLVLRNRGLGGTSAAGSGESMPTVATADVVVIGAGMAGLRATARMKEAAPHLKVVVLEATQRIGGRVWSFDTDDGRRLQNGANWLYYRVKEGEERKRSEQFPTTAIYWDSVGKDMAAFDDYLNTTVYRQSYYASDPPAVRRVPQRLFDRYTRRWKQEIVPCMDRLAKDYHPMTKSLPRRRREQQRQDSSVLKGLRRCGWNETDPIDFLCKNIWFDYDYSTEDASISAWDDTIDTSRIRMHFVTGDYNEALVAYARQHGIEPILGARVTKVQYDGLPSSSSRETKAHVTVQDEATGRTIVYQAQRVVSTVSSGVYEHGLIEFDPPLRYPSWQYNPMKLKNYVKIFIQFPTNFWGTDEHYLDIVAVDAGGKPGVSFWQNLDRPEIFPGSRMLLLSLFDEGFAEAVGAERTRRAAIDPRVLDGLLDPLRATYGDGFAEPRAIHHNTFHADPNFGYGAYASWDPGYSHLDYYHFWGAYDGGDFVRERCDHNGCNSHGEWVLFLAGTDSCEEHWSTVHGGWYGGEYAANLLMERSLGLDIGWWEQKCYNSSDSL